jgi:hypothetical protein
MPGDPLTCPYCNTEVPESGILADHRAVCSLCGETFRILSSQTPASRHIQPAAGITGITPAPTPATLDTPPGIAPRKPLTNRLLGAIILGVMLVMASLALVFALLTQSVRRSYDTGLPGRGGRASIFRTPLDLRKVQPLPPARLSGLRYLLPDTSFLFAVRVAELEQLPAGRDLLHNPIRLDRVDIALDRLASAVGTSLSEVDHLILGIHVQDPLPPRLQLVIRTRRPYHARALLEKLQARRARIRSRRELYTFESSELPFPLILWCADANTLVVELEDQEAEPDRLPPYADLDHLPSEIRDLLEKRMSPGGPVWLAAHSPNWSDAPTVTLVEKLKKEDFSPLKKADTFAIWLQFLERPLLRAVAHCQTEEETRALEQYLKGTKPPATLKTVREQHWLSVQYPLNLSDLRQALQQ